MSNINPYDIIIRPVLTEKSYDGVPIKRYAFIVSKSANKTQIKQAVETIFKVDVEEVNTINMLGKMKRQGRTEGRRPSYKKAIVQLTSKSKGIEFFESLS